MTKKIFMTCMVSAGFFAGAFAQTSVAKWQQDQSGWILPINGFVPRINMPGVKVNWPCRSRLPNQVSTWFL